MAAQLTAKNYLFTGTGRIPGKRSGRNAQPENEISPPLLLRHVVGSSPGSHPQSKDTTTIIFKKLNPDSALRCVFAMVLSQMSHRYIVLTMR
jgi:hypothetical protein